MIVRLEKVEQREFTPTPSFSSQGDGNPDTVHNSSVVSIADSPAPNNSLAKKSTRNLVSGLTPTPILLNTYLSITVGWGKLVFRKHQTENERIGVSFTKAKRGFTLIELLVVIAIISLLSTVVLASLNEVRASARDARRVSDLRSIRDALELYRNKEGDYPLCVGYMDNENHCLAQVLKNAGVMENMPVDPLYGNNGVNQWKFDYQYSTDDGTWYILRAGGFERTLKRTHSYPHLTHCQQTSIYPRCDSGTDTRCVYVSGVYSSSCNEYWLEYSSG